MKKVDIVIRYEHKVRELESIMLLKIEMERRGYTVEFTANYDFFQDERSINPRLIVSPAIYNDGQLNFDLSRYGLKKKIVNLLAEQLMGIKEEEDPDGYHNVTGTAQRIVTFCWGENTKRRLVAAGLEEDKALVVGQLSTDMLHGPLAKTLKNKIELSKLYGIDENKRWNLFISSFAYCELDDFQRVNIRNIYGEKYLNEFTEVSLKSREQILEWFEAILKLYPDDIIIYRPHPDEARKSNALRLLEKQYDNFRVIADLPIKHWINAADKIYNWYSTGIIDAQVLKKPIRILRPCFIPEDYDYRILYHTNHIQTLNDFLKDYESLDTDKGLDYSVISDYYYIPDSYVYIKICDVLEEMLNSNKFDIRYSLSEYYHFGRLYLRRKFVESVNFLEPYARKMHLFNKVFKRRDTLRKVLKEGYKKNIATAYEIEDMYNLLKPIIDIYNSPQDDTNKKRS